MSTRIILLRHGQSSYNSQGRIQGRCDESVLTEKGRKDAQTTGLALKSIKFDAVYSSPLQRAQETAKIVVSCLDNKPNLAVNYNLQEIDLPLWEKLLKDEVKEKYRDDYHCWKNTPDQLKMTIDHKGEIREFFPVLSLFEQARNFWQELLANHTNQTILIVAHNGINRALLSTALGISAEYYHSIQQSNCGISVLNFAGKLEDNVQLESLNQINHMGEILPTLRKGSFGPRFLIIRHGETDWNRAGKFQGQIDVPLNDNGRNQAKLAGEFLKDITIDFAYSSPMQRPYETAKIILQHHPNIKIETDADLREISHGLWEGKFESEIDQEYPGELEQWRTKPETVQMPEGENLQDVWDRAIAAWENLLGTIGNQNKTGIVVAHDATNKVLLCYLMGLKISDFWQIKQGNGAVTVVDYPEGIKGKPVIQSLNLTAHLSGSILDKTAAGAL